MKEIREKIVKKKEILHYVEKLINEYSEKINYCSEDLKSESKKGLIKTVLFGVILAMVSLVLHLTANTSFFIASLVATTPFLASSILGLPISIIMTLESKIKLKKELKNLKNLLNVACLRKEYEKQTINELEEQCSFINNMNNEPNLASEIELPLVKEEIKAFAFNTHKIIKAKKSGKLNNFLCDRFNVTSQEAINLYENMINLYLNFLPFFSLLLIIF